MATSLEEQSLERKAKLQALRGRKAASETLSNKASDSSQRKPVLKFRNYNPQTEQLQEKKLPRAKPESIETQVQEQLESGKEPDTVKDVSLSKLAPKKVDWDLKRDISRKLEKLERRTQRAIVELIRDRLQEGDSGALATAVATAEQPSTTTQDSDSD